MMGFFFWTCFKSFSKFLLQPWKKNTPHCLWHAAQVADRRTTHSWVCSFIHLNDNRQHTQGIIQVTQIQGDWLLLPQKDTPSTAGGAGCRGCAYKSASLDVSWGRQREVFPLPGSQDFPHSTINFHFGKSAHTHSHSHTHTHTHTQTHTYTHAHAYTLTHIHNGVPHLVQQRLPGKRKSRTVDLTFIVLVQNARKGGRRHIGSAQVELCGASFFFFYFFFF